MKIIELKILIDEINNPVDRSSQKSNKPNQDRINE